MSDPIEQFRDALRGRGIVPPDNLLADGCWHPCPVDGKRGKDKGRYRLFPDCIGGHIQNHTDGLDCQHWRADIGRSLTPAEEAAHRAQVDAARKLREAEEAKSKQAARETASLLLAEASPVASHAYLTRKGIAAHHVKTLTADKARVIAPDLSGLTGDLLIIPMWDTAGVLHSLQLVTADGIKRFLKGGRKHGCYFGIGKPDGVLCIAEGFATGASIHEATGHAVAVAFDAGSLLPVAQALRAKFPDLRLILCADDDYRTDGNPGLTKATEAARAVGGLVAVPDFGVDRPDGATDFNDLHKLDGLEAVLSCVNAAAPPDPKEKAASEATNAARGTALSGSEDNTQPASAAMGFDGCNAPVVRLTQGSTITPEAIDWLWPGWLASGKFHVFGGAPGTGKTTIALSLAATISQGGCWPDGTAAPVGNVAIWSGEDDPQDTLVPRLAAMGADLSRIYFIDGIDQGHIARPFDPAKDMQHLERQLLEMGGVRLLMVDPVVSAVSGDSHKGAETRRGLQPLVDLGAKIGCAVLGITHFSKGTGGRDPVERITGSLAFGALARIVLVAAKAQSEEGDEQAARIFCRAKSNIGQDSGGFGYDLHQSALAEHPGVFASSVLWGDAIDGAARELLATADATGDDGEGGSLGDAKRFLTDLLQDGPLPSRQVMADAREAGYSEKTTRRAKDALGIRPVKEGGSFGTKGQHWTWRLPDPNETKTLKMAKNTEDAHLKRLATFREIGHLQQKTGDKGDLPDGMERWEI